MRPKSVFAVAVLFLILLASLTCFSQQTFISRYDGYAGYTFLSTPSLNLFQNGFNGEFGVNVKPWVALGGDFSVFNGSNTLLPNMFSNTVQQQVGVALAELAQQGLLPPGYTVRVPADSTIYTYEAGPQFNYRHFKAITLFVRPSLGALHEVATLKPTDPITTGLVQALVGSSMKRSDTVVFYGVGGGADLNVSQHFGIRAAVDYAHYNVFSGLLNGDRNSVRFSVGPTFRFGENIVKK